MEDWYKIIVKFLGTYIRFNWAIIIIFIEKELGKNYKILFKQKVNEGILNKTQKKKNI